MCVAVLASTCLSLLVCMLECETERSDADAEALCLSKAAVPPSTIFVTCSENVTPDSNGAPPLPEITLEVSPPPGG